MVLASQMARSDSMRRVSARRRGKLGSRRVWLLGVVAAFAVWYLWPSDRAGEPDAATAPLAAVTPAAVRDAGAAGASANPAQAATSPAPAAPAAPAGPAASAAPAGSSHANSSPNVPGSPDFLARIKAALDAEAARHPAAVPSAGGAKAASPSPSNPASKAGPPVLDLGGANPKPANDPSRVPPPVPSDPAALPAPPGSSPAAPAPSDARPAGPPAAPAPAPLPDLNRVTFTTTGTAGDMLRAGMNQIADGKFVDGRKTLSALLAKGDPALSALDAQTIRDTLASINKNLIFSSQALDGDPLVELYSVQSSDLLSNVARRHKVTYQLLEQVNNVDARRIRVGQKLKVIKGPFHAVVDKSDFRMDLFLKDSDEVMIYITSFPVGVGKDDSTPVGRFLCRPAGKLANPGWTDPRTSQYFTPDDPKNPIGEYWIALDGTDEQTKGLRGYGVHGTVEPQSIGKQMSLGCVRLLPKDIEMVYKLLADGHSTVAIQP